MTCLVSRMEVWLMAATVTVELPEKVLVQALRQLSPARRRQLWLSLEADSPASQRESRPAALVGRRRLTGRWGF